MRVEAYLCDVCKEVTLESHTEWTFERYHSKTKRHCGRIKILFDDGDVHVCERCSRDILEVRLPVKRGGERQSKIIGDRRDVVNKYVKIPVVIQAIQWTGENHRNIYDFLTGTTGEAMSSSGDNFYIDHDKVSAGLVIKTLEGDILARVDDYIVKGVRGEFYPIKPDIFEILYNPVATD